MEDAYNMYVLDLIKVKYVREGYLPDIPYRMISANETIEAFKQAGGYFDITYPNISEDREAEYEALKQFMYSTLDSFVDTGSYVPTWIYSYMLGEVTGPKSSSEEIDYLASLIGIDDYSATQSGFSSEMSDYCYKVSFEWLQKNKDEHRPPTIFGEPHVIKSLRLKEVNVLA